MMVRDSECAVFVEEDPEKKNETLDLIPIRYIYIWSLYVCVLSLNCEAGMLNRESTEWLGGKVLGFSWPARQL